MVESSGREQCARLRVADRLRRAFLAGHLRPLHAVDRVALDRVVWPPRQSLINREIFRVPALRKTTTP